jgi:hypothetical protein
VDQVCDTCEVLSAPPTLEEQLSVLRRIKDAIDLNLAELSSAYSQGSSLGMVAWLARNLLELAIWSEHCAASKENAKEFLLDAARDAHDALDVPEGPWLRSSLAPTRQLLLDNAAADGFDIEQDYAAVSRVAKKLGRGDLFRSFNKAFSKHAHPTALEIFSAGTEFRDALRKKFYESGSNLADTGLSFFNEGAKRIIEQMQSKAQDTAINDPVVHWRISATHATCGARLEPGETHPVEVNEETERIVNCPECREKAIAPYGAEHGVGPRFPG